MLPLSPIFTGMHTDIENISRTSRNMVRCGKKLDINIYELYEGKPSFEFFLIFLRESQMSVWTFSKIHKSSFPMRIIFLFQQQETHCL